MMMLDSHGSARTPALVLAEDDDEIRGALALLFRYDGFDVTTVPDGARLLEHLSRCMREHRLPDVIITDHRMPGCSSTDVLAHMRETGCDVPVIVITAFGREVAATSSKLGACAVFEKPFDPDDLRTAVLYWLRDRGRS